MRKSTSICMSAAVAAVLTHGMVSTAVNFSELPPLPVWTYDGFFQRVLLAMERLWSAAHGWHTMSHIREFGNFYAPVIHLLCPLIGFALFWILSRQRAGAQIWKPLTIAVVFAIPGLDVTVSREATAWFEAARTMAVVVAMIWSVGASYRVKRYEVAESRA